MIADASKLELKYRYSAAAYGYIERRCHDDTEPAVAKQRVITHWSLEIVRGARADLQPFTNLFIQFPQADTEEPDQVAPDNWAVVHTEPLKTGVSFDTPFQPVGPFIVAQYVTTDTNKWEQASRRKYEKELKVPYYLLFYPDADEFTLFRLGEKGYSTVVPNANGRCLIPELELEVGLLGKWMRYWFRGELLPLPGDLLKERDAERSARLAAEKRAAEAEAELAKLRAQVAKANEQQE
jgi:hypothetical protein